MFQGSSEIREFIQRKGAIEVILEIDLETGNVLSDLVDKVSVSQNTVSSRLKEARKLGICGVTLLKDDHGNADRYRLEWEGVALRLAMESCGLDDAYQRLREAQSDLDTGTDQMEKWLETAQQKNDLTEMLTDEGYPGGKIENLEDPEDEFEKHLEREEEFRDKREF